MVLSCYPGKHGDQLAALLPGKLIKYVIVGTLFPWKHMWTNQTENIIFHITSIGNLFWLLNRDEQGTGNNLLFWIKFSFLMERSKNTSLPDPDNKKLVQRIASCAWWMIMWPKTNCYTILEPSSTALITIFSGTDRRNSCCSMYNTQRMNINRNLHLFYSLYSFHAWSNLLIFLSLLSFKFKHSILPFHWMMSSCSHHTYHSWVW